MTTALDIVYCPKLPPPAERRLIRKAAGWTLERMADEIGVAHTSIIQWERGAEPRPRSRETYANVLHDLQEQVNKRRR